MATLGRRRANGLPLGANAPTGVAPGPVGNFVVTTTSTTTITVSYTAASGTAPITYTGFTAPHGSTVWTQNSGSFSGTGGTFTGLTATTSYDLRIVAANLINSSVTTSSAGVLTSAAAATTFTITLSNPSGAAGSSVTMTVSPVGGPWPAGETVTPSMTGLAGSFDNASLTGSGTSSLAFTFTPVSGPGTSGTLSASAPGMVNSSGAKSYSVNPVVTAGRANRFDIVLSNSVVAPGSPVPITVYPNGTFPSGTITFSGTNGTFAPSATATLASGSANPVTLSYTPNGAGEHAISASNTASLYNPYPAPLTVFSAASGASRSISASLTRANLVTFQRDTFSGNPVGFSFNWTKGWGEVWVNVTAISGTTSGLWVKLYDAQSTNASAAVGSGTALNAGPVQIYGSIAGPGTIRVLLPAGPFIYYADIATDSSFTNPVRLAQRFRVGDVIVHDSRSFECGLSRGYAYGAATPLPTSYTKTATWVGFDRRYPDVDSGWYMHDASVADPYQYHYSEPASSAAQELGRLWESQRGVLLGIAGMSVAGGNWDDMYNADGSATGALTGTLATAIGNKARYYWIAVSDFTDSTQNTQASIRSRSFAMADWIARNYPATAVIGCVTGASGWFGTNGSATTGYTRNQVIWLNEIEPVNPMVVSKENWSWNEYNVGHASMAGRVQYARTAFRQLLAAEASAFGGFQTASRGPRLATSGTIRNGTRVISIPYTLYGGTSMVAVGITFSNPNYAVNAATNTELATLFAVYQSGGYAGNGTAIKIDGAAINTAAGTIDLTLSGTTGITFVDASTGAMPTNFTVQYAADFGVSNTSITPNWSGGPSRSVMLTDDRTDTANGIPFGWHMRPQLDIAISTI